MTPKRSAAMMANFIADVVSFIAYVRARCAFNLPLTHGNASSQHEPFGVSACTGQLHLAHVEVPSFAKGPASLYV